MPVDPTFASETQATHAPVVESLWRKDLAAAAALQQGLLPPNTSTVGQHRLTYQIWPSAPLSGDFVDVVELADTQMLFLVADVAGHGTAAAMVTMVLKSFMSRLAKPADESGIGRGEGSDPVELLAALNRELIVLGAERHVCALLGAVRPEGGGVVIAGAGVDPHPWLIRANAEPPLESIAVAGKALGLFDELFLEAQTVHLNPGDALVFATDGALELASADSVGERRKQLEAAVEQSSGHPPWQALGAHPDNGCPDDVTWFRLERVE